MNVVEIKLSQEEQAVLQGDYGATMQKVMESVVRYGQALGAEKLVAIEGPGHFVIPWALPWLGPPLEMLEELAAAGLRTKFPFTLDPCAPLDFENLDLETEVEEKIRVMFKDQDRYNQLLHEIGLRDEHAYTCNPYQPEVGNIPSPGTVLAWSESACAVFANSFLGARTNRNGAIMDLLSNIAGKTPYTGLLTDEGRLATWLIEVKSEKLPVPQVLGALIGKMVVADVPYIVGLDQSLDDLTYSDLTDYLQEMGAACATYGAVGLYHIENITPEAIAQGKELLIDDYNVAQITDNDLHKELASYPLQWSEPNLKPERCYIGCPHLSYSQLSWWAEKLVEALRDHNRERIAVSTVLFSAPQIIEKLKRDQGVYAQLIDAGVTLSPTCCETIFETGLVTGKPILTNSNKLRAYTSARFYPDEDLVEILATGELPEGVNDE
jgi:predicted aconitase